MKALYHMMGLIAAFCVTFVVLITSVEAVVYFNDGYFEEKYTKYNVLKRVHMEMDDLLYVTDEMMDYLKGEREDLVVNTIVDGEEREFFNEKEKRLLLLRMMQWGIGLFIGGMAGLAALISTDFTKYFTIFHLIFFDNDDWLLNPKTDLLINIVPEGFFRDTAYAIAFLFLGVCLFIWLTAALLRRRAKKTEE